MLEDPSPITTADTESQYVGVDVFRLLHSEAAAIEGQLDQLLIAQELLQCDSASVRE